MPEGRVATYGQIAKMAGFSGRARWAGWVLRNSQGESLPWHRIINAKGESSFPKDSPACKQQLQRLAQEGVSINNGRIDLKVYAYDPLDELLWGPPESPE